MTKPPPLPGGQANYYKKMLSVLYLSFFWFVDSMIFVIPRRRRKRHILMMRIDQLGDYVLWRDAAERLVRYYHERGARVVLLANRAWAELARLDLPCDDVWNIDPRRMKRDLFYRFRLLAKVRRARFEVIVHPALSRDALRGPLIARISGAAVKIAPKGDLAIQTSWQAAITDRWYTQIVDLDEDARTELERTASFMRRSGFPAFEACAPLLKTATGSPRPDAPENEYYILAPGAGWAGRQWSVAGFAEIAERLHAKTRWTGLVCGSPAEREIGKQLCARAKVPLRNFAGRTTLLNLVSLLRAARLLVGNETGSIHLAAALGVPSISIVGGGHFGRFLPYSVPPAKGAVPPRVVASKMACFGCNWQCIYPRRPNAPVPCIERVEIDSVWEEVHAVLRR